MKTTDWDGLTGVIYNVDEKLKKEKKAKKKTKKNSFGLKW